jgi:hypothetical protein
MRAATAQNPVTPSNTPVITGVFAKHTSSVLKTATANAAAIAAANAQAEDEVTERLKKLGQ